MPFPRGLCFSMDFRRGSIMTRGGTLRFLTVTDFGMVQIDVFSGNR